VAAIPDTLSSMDAGRRPFRYVGPVDLLALVRPDAGGQAIRSSAEFDEWVSGRTSEELGEPFTYVVGTAGALLLAPRRSEHVVCAGGEAVSAAGEISFHRESGRWAVAEVSNQSTGYCPDVDSWPSVADALDRAGLIHPAGFTNALLFRRCPACLQLNIVRDAEFICVFCDGVLPREWNIGNRV